MAHHPEPIVVEIVRIGLGDCGHACEEHQVCGVVLDEDVVVCFRKVQILVEGSKETAIAVYWVRMALTTVMLASFRVTW